VIEKDFYTYDRKVTGVKGLVILGDDFLVYRRDGNTKNHPFELDLIGGGSEADETPFETFAREALEETGLIIGVQNILVAGKHESVNKAGAYVYFVVAKLDETEKNNIHWGDEGIEYMLLNPNDYFDREDAWTFFQDRAKSYYDTLN
jgi:8-oxo-dGTP diphosphatase